MYLQYKVNVFGNQVDTLKDAIRFKKGASLCFPTGGIRGDQVLLLTPAQINRLDKAQVEGRRAQIRMSARQAVKNVIYTGVFSGMLARVLPTIMSGLTTGLLSGGINKAITGSGDRLKHKHGKCSRIQKCAGNGLYLAPHPRVIDGKE